MQYTFPDPETYGHCIYLVPIDAALVPLVSGALEKFQQRGVWASDSDYEQGYNAFAEVQEAMSGKCLQDLIESNNRLYRLLDTVLNGTVYSTIPPAQNPPPAPPSDPTRPTISPVIPAAPSASSPAALPAFALRRRLERLINLTDNLANGQTYALDAALSEGTLIDNQGVRDALRATQGVINAGWFGIGGQRATLADLVRTLRVGSQSDTARITDAIDAIAGDSGLAQTSQAANIFNTVRGLFEDVASAGGEGAVLATLIASSIATSGMLGVLAGQMDRLISSLDGGALAPPTDNVLTALRGTSPAGEDRNVIDAAFGGDLVPLLERLAVEVRAARGGSSPAENWRDPAADPADLGLSTIGGAIVETAAVKDQAVLILAKLEAIRLLVELLQSGGDIVPLIDGVESLLSDIKALLT